jgi:hypothetical protein
MLKSFSFLEMSAHDYRSVLEPNHIFGKLDHPESWNVFYHFVVFWLIGGFFKSRKLFNSPSLNSVLFEKVTFVRDQSLSRHSIYSLGVIQVIFFISSCQLKLLFFYNEFFHFDIQPSKGKYQE